MSVFITARKHLSANKVLLKQTQNSILSLSSPALYFFNAAFSILKIYVYTYVTLVLSDFPKTIA
jgi:hypothetical protein